MNIIKHETAVVESEKIGDGTRVAAFARIYAGAVLGKECVVGDHATIEDGVVIGNRVIIDSGVFVCGGVTLEDEVLVGPNVTFNNVLHPRSGRLPTKYLTTLIRRGASIGSNATLLPGVIVGMNVVVGAGTVVTRNIPPNAIVVGNPGRIVGYAGGARLPAVKTPELRVSFRDLAVPGVRLHELPIIKDLRGTLSFAQYEQSLPFVPKRYFIVYDVSDYEVRGEHAHKELHQFLVCVRGSGSVVVDNGDNRDEIMLDSPGIGLHVPPMVWATQYKFSRDAVLLVLASDVYKAEDYIRDYDEYLRLKKKA